MAVARCRHCSACSALPLDLYTSARLAWLTATAGWLFPYDFWYTRSPRSRLRSAWSRSPVACAAFPMFVKHRPAEAAITSCRKRQISVVFEMPLDDAVLIFDTRSRRCRMAAPITAAAMGMHARGGAGGGAKCRPKETRQRDVSKLGQCRCRTQLRVVGPHRCREHRERLVVVLQRRGGILLAVEVYLADRRVCRSEIRVLRTEQLALGPERPEAVPASGECAAKGTAGSWGGVGVGDSGVMGRRRRRCAVVVVPCRPRVR